MTTDRPTSAGGAALLVTMPALNEERTVGEIIRAVPRDIAGIESVEIVVVNDGSMDRTATEAAEAGAHVIHHARTRGVGAAFHSALAYGINRGVDMIVSIDADGQFDPADIPSLVAPVLDGEADFTTASRFKDSALTPPMPAIKRWGNRMMSRLISRLTGETFYDVSCGFRCYSRRATSNLHLLGRFTYTQEVFMNLVFKQLRIIEVPLRVRGVREHGRSRVAGNLFTYALNTLRIIFRCYRDYHPLRFFGALAVMLLVPSVGLGLFLLWHYVTAGTFSPHKWAGFTGAALFVLALMVAYTGLLADMLNRHRVYLEELLYYRRLESSQAIAEMPRRTPAVRGDADDDSFGARTTGTAVGTGDAADENPH